MQNFAYQWPSWDKLKKETEVRLLVLIKDDKYVGWENLIVLNVIRLYLNRIRYEMGSQCSFCR